MNRLTMPVVLCLLGCAVVCVPAGADDTPKKLTADERKELEARREEQNKAGFAAFHAAKYADAHKAYAATLGLDRRLYPKEEFPDGHEKLAASMANTAELHHVLGDSATAEALYKEALEMRRRLYKGDHAQVAASMATLSYLYGARGKNADAEPLARDALAMLRRLHKGDQSDVSSAMGHLALVYYHQGKYAAAEALFEDALAMDRRLVRGDDPQLASSMNNLAVVYQTQGKFAAAEPLLVDVLAIRKRVYKGDNPFVAGSLNNLAVLYHVRGRPADAEPLLVEMLAMQKRMFTGDHPAVAAGMNSLASVYQEQGKYAAAERLFTDAAAMHKRMTKGDHPLLAVVLNNLAELYRVQHRLDDAERMFVEALDMRRRMYKGAHPFVATTMNNLALVYTSQEKYADAVRLHTAALEMRRKLFAGDHLDTAGSLNNLASVHEDWGDYAGAEPLFADALAMRKRLYKGDHPEIAMNLNSLGRLLHRHGKAAEAAKALREALAMSGRLTAAYARQKSEGEALTLTAARPLYRDILLSAARSGANPEAAFADVWASKGDIARVYERRQQQARAADPKAAGLLAELADARRRRAELLLAPEPKDSATRDKRDDDLKVLAAQIAKADDRVRPLLPVVARAERLDAATVADLQKALPGDTALVDFLRSRHAEFDEKRPGKLGESRTPRYLAFVVTRDKIAWVDLDTAANIEPAVDGWRDAITSGRAIPAALPAKIRALVWAKVRNELPPTIKTVYVCPDAALCRLPFAALPGDRPGTILLEDFALATIPHAPFLLDKLLPPDTPTRTPAAALVVGGVKYDAVVAPDAVASRGGGPLVKPDAKLTWGFLPNTAGEAAGVAAAAARRKLSPTRLDGAKATPAAVLAALPKAKVAHLATHGFFADPSFRGTFQLDEADYEMRAGERVGRAVNSPLVMTGLVLAGANDPGAPGRGIVTGESLIDLDLSGLELAVLSACETGVGDTAGGQGTFGLQRAFHNAGTTNVVASLWKVPDQSTAALMALFYQDLWERNLPPMEVLRQAQLEVYRNPGKVPELAEGFRGKFQEVGGAGTAEAKSTADGRAHPLLWAAFTLSGPGR